MIKTVTEATLSDLLARAAGTARRRLNLNLHGDPADPTNRFVNAGLAGSYVRPHRHRPGRWELLSALRGRLDIVFFDASGLITQRLPLRVDATPVVEIPGGQWHTVLFQPPAAAVLEIKPGPYEPALDKEFASWAPAEDDSRAAEEFLHWLADAQPGDRAPGAAAVAGV